MKHDSDPLIRSMLFGHGGLEIVVDPHILPKEWEFPHHDFFEYEPKDEYWCRALGIGREVCRIVYRVGNRLIMHPTMYEEFKKQVRCI